MTEDYDPRGYERFPHNRYRCQCGESVVAVGWEVEAIFCDSCFGNEMDWEETLHHPRGYYHETS